MAFIFPCWPTWWASYKFAFHSDSDKMVQHSTHIPSYLGDMHNVLDPFLASNLTAYSFELYFPLGSYYHNLIYVFCPVAPLQLPRPTLETVLLGFCFNFTGKPEDVLFLFHIKLPLFLNQRAFCVCVEVIVSGMERCILHIFSISYAKTPWFKRTCAHTIEDTEAAHKRKQSLPTPENYALYISAWNWARSVLLIHQELSSVGKAIILPTLILLKISVT